MTLLYRAIWQDAIPHLDDTVANAFAAWVSDIAKWGDVITADDIASNSRISVTGQRNQTTVNVDVKTDRVAEDTVARAGSVYRAELIETFANPDVRWHTTIRAWQDTSTDTAEEGASWIWVDNEVVGDLQPNKIASAAPRIVRNLLDGGRHPRVHSQRIFTLATPVTGSQAAEDLAESISDFGRALPIVVVHDTHRSRSAAEQTGTPLSGLADMLARSAAGIASIYTLDDAAASGLTEALGRDFGLWGGVMRVYLPGLDPADASDGYRHRYFFPDRYCASRAATQRYVISRVAPLSALRRAPATYPAAKARLDEAIYGGNDAELLEVADAELKAAEEEARNMRQQVQDIYESLEELAIDLAVALEERAELQRVNEQNDRHIASLQAQLTAPDEFDAEAEAPTTPATCGSPSEAARLARQHLSNFLLIPDTALVDLDELDATVTSQAWGQTSWEAFQALHAYVADRASGWNKGGFWEWCVNSANQKAWRATPKKLAMVESQSVRDRYKHTREFTVPTDVDPNGKIYMEAHMKIAEGGGDLAPRVYFDEELRQGRMIVGFFGPHRHLPNTRT